MSCTVHGCDRDHEARGYCRRHYQRWQRDAQHVDRQRRGGPLSHAELVRLRRAVGLPDEGATAEHRRRWHEQEMQGGTR